MYINYKKESTLKRDSKYNYVSCIYIQVIILKELYKTGLNLDKSKIVIKLDFRSQKDINIVSDIYKQVYKIHKCIKLHNT